MQVATINHGMPKRPPLSFSGMLSLLSSKSTKNIIRTTPNHRNKHIMPQSPPIIFSLNVYSLSKAFFISWCAALVFA